MSSTLVQPNLNDSSVGSGRWMVTIFNNDHTPVQDVITILMKATGCGTEEANIETWEAHTFGKAQVHFARRTECEQVATVISSIGVKTEVSKEWEE